MAPGPLCIRRPSLSHTFNRRHHVFRVLSCSRANTDTVDIEEFPIGEASAASLPQVLLLAIVAVNPHTSFSMGLHPVSRQLRGRLVCTCVPSAPAAYAEVD